MKLAPEVLAARAVHSYRKRDIFAYVSLRQYLKNSATLRDRWSDGIATELSTDRKTPIFNEVKSFKEIGTNQEPDFRTLHFPGPNDILAETALLAACEEAGGMFRRHPCVFSNILASGDETRGVFLPHFDGFKARHAAIAKACRAMPDAVVIYTDIKKFYPSVTVELALRVWNSACEQSNLGSNHHAFGIKLLEDARRYQRDVDGDASILTGPMISHLIGNLVLRGIDENMARECPEGYFRYVDDIAIVAIPDHVLELEQRLKGHLERLGLHLHDEDKRLITPCKEWLDSANDFDDPLGSMWIEFIADMKRLLLFNPGARQRLTDAFHERGIRINPLDYGEVVQESHYLKRLKALAKFHWFRRSVRSRAWILHVISQSMFLRAALVLELNAILKSFRELKGYERKRKIYRLRFLVSRILYLVSTKELKVISDSISGIAELAMAASVYNAVISRDVSELLRLGPTAAQAAAQALLADGKAVSCKSVDWSAPAVVQACAVLLLNGLKVEADVPLPNDPALLFSDWTEQSFSLYHSQDAYFRELGCIHGVDAPDLNRWAIESAFDRDDEMVFDIQDLMQGYPY